MSANSTMEWPVGKLAGHALDGRPAQRLSKLMRPRDHAMKSLALTLLAALTLTACGGDDAGGLAAAASGVATGQPIPIEDGTQSAHTPAQP